MGQDSQEDIETVPVVEENGLPPGSNGTSPIQTIHQLIAHTAGRVPQDIAVLCETQSLSYGQLDQLSTQFAHQLQSLGVKPGVLVGLCVERSLEMVVGLLGILKAGGAYVPLDPAYPKERLAYMLEDSNASIIVTQTRLKEALPDSQTEVVCLDSDWGSLADESTGPLPSFVQPDDLAYVIYTSGSTGRPKGVEIPHRAVVNFLKSMRQRPGLQPEDRLLAVTTLSFDIAGLELYLPLVVGAQVIIANREVASDGTRLAKLMESMAVTVMQATPATWRLLLEANWKGSQNIRILCGGETLTRELAERLLPKCRELWNLYGPTESTIWSTLHRVETGSGPVPIGLPIANTEIQLLDEQLKPVPAGAPGELFIGGEGLARGYFQREELTNERFIPHPLEPQSRKRLYRTGDLAKYLPDGSLEHMGRVDFQVKVRGFRIELGEIESVLDQHETVKQAVVMAREDVPGEKRLVAYFVPTNAQVPSSRELRAVLASRLPDYMIPGLYVSLKEFPLTPNGKVDRKALPAPDLQRPELAVDYTAPRTEEEAKLANIWAEVLRMEKVGIHDNFFELGGDSLKVAQVATRIRDVFHVDMFLRSMFENPTVAEVLPIILAGDPRQDVTKELSITEVTRGTHIPPSFSQERVWFIHQLNPDNLAYNFQSSIDFRGKLDVKALERSLGEILRRHESYRTSFPTVDGRPVQVIHPYIPYSLPIVDLTDKPEAEREAAAKAWCAEEFQIRFDLAKLPLVRWTLLRYSDERNVLIHMEHHLVHDGWAFNVFLTELVDLYRAYTAGQESPLPELPVQFAEFATWQHEWMQGEVSEHQLAYWKKKFQTLPPVLELPIKGARPPQQTFRGTSLRPEIPVELCNQLRALSRQEGTTLFMTMLTVFIAMLHRYTGETDVAVGTFFANRRARESEGLIGMILNNVVIRAALDTNPTGRQLMKHVRDVMLEGASYQDVPFNRVVEAVQPKRETSLNPLFHLVFSFHDEPMPEEKMPGLEVKLTPVLSNGSAKFDLVVIGIPHSSQYLGLPQGSENDGLTMIWEHNTDLFETSTIARMIEHYKALLASLVANPDLCISDLAMVPVDETRRMLQEWNATQTDDSPTVCLYQLIEQQAAKTPESIAIVCGPQKVSYRDLDHRSNQLANYLRDRGVGPNVLVGISVERSADMLIGLLGILKAGGAYVPIDPTFPIDRQAFMVDDANISILVTEKDIVRHLPVEGKTVVSLDADLEAIAAESEHLQDGSNVTPDDLAYVIYTSGSTGRPKGVQIPHRAIVNFLESMRSKPGISSADRLFAVTTLSFDIAGLEMYLPLTVGARVIVSSRAVATNGEELAQQLQATGATIMQATPSTWQMLLDSGWKGNPNLTVLCGGEALPRALAEQLLSRVKTVWNMYGPTETTVWSTIHQVESGDGNVPIGRPIQNTQIYVLDRYDNPVPVGVRGELCIGGAGLALGYLNRPELTSEKFITNPTDEHTSLIYRTGDLARFRPDGTLECLGRIDHQIKLRGFRIELGEIETLVSNMEGIRQAVVITREDTPGDGRLVAYVVLQDHASITSNDVLAKLKTKLPDYMVPSSCMVLETIPLTPNGKVDRKALPKPTGERSEGSSAYVAPRTDQERKLTAIWEQLLGVSPLGIQDDFFEVGGHSLLAVRLVSEIEVQTGTRISLGSLLQGRTIEYVAQLLEGDREAQGDPSFVALQTSGTKPPFFVAGSHPRYVEIAQRLGSDRPFYRLDLYALESQRIAQGLQPFTKIEDFAKHYLEKIRSIQPKGPYYLGGGCEGAYLSFEMAVQLQKQGEEVGCLVMWIPPPLGHSRGLTLRRFALYLAALRFRYLLTGGALRHSSWSGIQALLRHEHIEYRILQALCSYAPRENFRGGITLVRTADSPAPVSAVDINQQWVDLATEGAELHVVPGNHGNWLEDHLDDFIRVLEGRLEPATMS